MLMEWWVDFGFSRCFTVFIDSSFSIVTREEKTDLHILFFGMFDSSVICIDEYYFIMNIKDSFTRWMRIFELRLQIPEPWHVQLNARVHPARDFSNSVSEKEASHSGFKTGIWGQ